MRRARTLSWFGCRRAWRRPTDLALARVRYTAAMSAALNLARLAALVAIFGFFLPWAEVSCSGQPLVHETGIQLITGGAGGTGPHGHNIWVAASLAIILLGLAVGVIARGRRAAMILMAAAPIAAVASLIGVSQEVSSAEAQIEGTGSEARPAAESAISTNLKYGYFVTLGGLIVAFAAGGFALRGGSEPE